MKMHTVVKYFTFYAQVEDEVLDYLFALDLPNVLLFGQNKNNLTEPLF